ALAQRGGREQDGGSFAGAARRDVADADDLGFELLRFENAPFVKAAAQTHGQAVKKGGGRQHDAAPKFFLQFLAAVGPSLHLGASAGASKSLRAASNTRSAGKSRRHSICVGHALLAQPM